MSATGRMSIFRGSLLSISLRWAYRLIGFISTLILARLLVPADFGLIAMASLVIGLADVLLDLGVNVALIQNPNATTAHYNTAWTLRLIQTATAGLLVYLAAPLAAVYFGDPRIVLLLQVMAIGLPLAGLENIGVIAFQKEMQFGRDFRFVLLKRIASFLITLLAAWLLRSYWALVIGALFGRTFGVALSYLMHPMRPRVSFEKLGEIFSVSQWMLVRSSGIYLHNNLHKMMVGRQVSPAIMGGYSLASDISEMPSSELLSPLNRVLFPAFVHAKHDVAELKRLFILAQGVQSLLAIPAGAGLALVAYEVVLVLLGEKWLLAVPFVQVLALACMVQAITTSGGYVMIAMGRVRSSALFAWFQVILFAATVVVILPNANAIQIAWSRVFTLVAGLSLSVWMLTRTLPNIRLIDVAGTVIRPILGTGAMAIAVTSIGEFHQHTTAGSLLLKIATGFTAYVSAIMLMWWIAGKPSSAETYILNKVLAARRNNKWLQKFGP